MEKHYKDKSDHSPHNSSRRTALKGMTGGLLAVAAGSSLLGGTSPVVAKTLTHPAINVDGSVLLLPELAKVMPASQVLMNSLATEFAPIAEQLETQQSYWIALNGWITDRLSGPIMEGEIDAKHIGEQAWAVFASAYWGGMELRVNWGMPPAMDRLGIKMSAPFSSLQHDLATALSTRVAALEKGGKSCLELLDTLLHDDSAMGVIWNIAYNAGCQVVKTEDPPIGQRRPHRQSRPSAVRINTRDFMRVDYDLPSPYYLKVWRSNFERAVTAKPEEYEKAIVGKPGQISGRDIWKKAVNFGNITWGAGANDMWTTEYFDDVLHWSTVVNFGMEAAGQAAFVAVINKDEDSAKRAVMGNAIYLGMASGWLMGMLDVDGKLPILG